MAGEVAYIQIRELHVQVTRADIDKANRRYARNCGISRAIRRMYPSIRSVQANADYIAITDGQGLLRYFHTPQVAAEWMRNFDNFWRVFLGQGPEPFEFRAIEAVPSLVDAVAAWRIAACGEPVGDYEALPDSTAVAVGGRRE